MPLDSGLPLPRERVIEQLGRRAEDIIAEMAFTQCANLQTLRMSGRTRARYGGWQDVDADWEVLQARGLVPSGQASKLLHLDFCSSVCQWSSSSLFFCDIGAACFPRYLYFQTQRK